MSVSFPERLRPLAFPKPARLAYQMAVFRLYVSVYQYIIIIFKVICLYRAYADVAVIDSGSDLDGSKGVRLE